MDRHLCTRERGAALIVALLILLVLTVIGISLINTTTFETAISGNERARVAAFYAAEAGIQEAIAKLPDRLATPRTEIGKDSYYWSGTVKDRDNPRTPESLGLAFQYGYELSEVGFQRIRIRMTGESQGAAQELEVQVRASHPIRPSTEYNN